MNCRINLLRVHASGEGIYFFGSTLPPWVGCGSRQIIVVLLLIVGSMGQHTFVGVCMVIDGGGLYEVGVRNELWIGIVWFELMCLCSVHTLLTIFVAVHVVRLLLIYLVLVLICRNLIMQALAANRLLLAFKLVLVCQIASLQSRLFCAHFQKDA